MNLTVEEELRSVPDGKYSIISLPTWGTVQQAPTASSAWIMTATMNRETVVGLLQKNKLIIGVNGVGRREP